MRETIVEDGNEFGHFDCEILCPWCNDYQIYSHEDANGDTAKYNHARNVKLE